MVQNVVELRVMAINTAKEFARNVDSLIKEARKIEKYIQGKASIPNVVEDTNQALIKCFEKMHKEMQPLPPLPEISTKTKKKKNKRFN